MRDRLPAGCLYPNSKVHGVNMGPIWGPQDPGGPHVGPMNCYIPLFSISVAIHQCAVKLKEPCLKPHITSHTGYSMT